MSEVWIIDAARTPRGVGIGRMAALDAGWGDAVPGTAAGH
jgi:hypothetical protein